MRKISNLLKISAVAALFGTGGLAAASMPADAAVACGPYGCHHVWHHPHWHTGYHWHGYYYSGGYWYPHRRWVCGPGPCHWAYWGPPRHYWGPGVHVGIGLHL